MNRKGAVCTIVAKNYLPHARCLLDSVAQFHPDLAQFVFLADQADGYFDGHAEPFTVITSEQLAIPDSKWFHFKYSLLELCTAVKPYAIEHLLSAYGFDYVIYLDPDILVCSALDSLLDRLEYYSMLVTPHATGPLDPRLGPSELDILRTGTYNLGFLGVSRTAETLAFLEWWKERLYRHCVVDLPRGLFLDQRWIDFAPSFISRFCVVREPGYNVAYWNLSQREVSFSRGRFTVNGQPLIFFHFSGFDPDAPDRLSRYRPGCHMPENGVRELAQQYRRLLFDYGYSECRDWPYAYGYFRNGVRIPDLGRSVDQEDSGVTGRIADPFSDEGFQEFVRVWNCPLSPSPGMRPTVTRLAYKIYRTQADLQAAMPDIFNGNYAEFRSWFLSSGAGEHALPDVFLAPFKNGEPREAPSADTGRKAIVADGDFWRASNLTPQQSFAQELSAGTAGLCTSRLALEIYRKRPDLQAFFPDPAGKDAVKYLVWLLSYGKREYRISKVFLSTLCRQWSAVVASLPSVRERLRYRTLLALANAIAVLGPLVGRVVRAHLLLRSFRTMNKLEATPPGEKSPTGRSGDPANGGESAAVCYGAKTAGD